MAIENIATGYNPQFALGALYHGFNAGSQDNANQLANLAKEWELQKSQAEDPYKVLESIYSGELANAKTRDPNYIPWQLKGQMGQMQTQDAQGRKAQALYGDDLAASKQKLANELLTGQLEQGYNEERADKFNTIRNGEYPLGSIGFPMQSQQPTGGGIGFPTAISGAQGNEGRVTRGDISMPQSVITDQLLDNLRMVESGGGKNTYNKESGATGDFQFIPATVDMLRKQGINFDPNNPAQARQAARLYLEQLVQQNGGDVRKALAAYGGFKTKDPTDYINKVLGGSDKSSSVLSSFQKQPQQNQWLAGVDTQDPRWNSIQGFMMDTPKFRGEMAKGEQKTDAQLEAAEMRNRALVQAAEAKNTIKDPKYKEILAKNMDIVDTVTVQHNAGKPVSEADQLAYLKAARFIQQHERMLQISNPAAFQPRLDMAAISGMPMTSTPTQQAVASFPTIDFGKPGGQPTPQTPATVDGRPVTKLQ